MLGSLLGLFALEAPAVQKGGGKWFWDCLQVSEYNETEKRKTRLARALAQLAKERERIKKPTATSLFFTALKWKAKQCNNNAHQHLPSSSSV